MIREDWSKREVTRELDPGMKTGDESEKSLRSSAKSVGCMRIRWQEID